MAGRPSLRSAAAPTAWAGRLVSAFLVCGLGACADDGALVSAVAAAAPTGPAEPEGRAAPPARPALRASQADPFAPAVIQPPAAAPPPAAVAVEPPHPTAPALPFTFIARLQGPELNAVYVRRDDQVLLLTEGAELDGGYRVERIGPREAVFTWLPGGERQTLALP